MAGLTEEELNSKYPNRPHNNAEPLPFHDLVSELLNPLNENKQKPAGPPQPWRRKVGPHGGQRLTPHEQRRQIIERFITRWRKEVGPDLFPVMRLILPDKDRERAMYGLKERAIGKLLVRIVKIDKNSPDAQNLINWKLPGQSNSGVSTSGDFAARCEQILSKRQVRHQPSDIIIDEVNQLLDRLSLAQKEDAQVPIFETFYRRMTANELMWLIRIILRQTKVGATEKTFFDIFHPDADMLFNVSSNLRRVCWELHDPNIRLEEEDTDVNIMQCFQPQLAQFQSHSFEKMVQKLRPTEQDKEFWIEEKLDGERMQLHMCQDNKKPGGYRFAFFSRKAKDYTDMYGESLEQHNSALTKHLKKAFHDGVRNIILDGEMITYDTELGKMIDFGTLKTAAKAAQMSQDPNEQGVRPIFKVFDILYLNDKVLTKYTLRDRRKALQQSVNGVPGRLEVQNYKTGTKWEEIEPALRDIVANASEGLVIKNPRASYRLNSRNDDWAKVKPEYMAEYGEELDCVIVGGYYGSGRRGNTISSFLCGLRVDKNYIDQGARPEKCWSFFKVGGGFAKSDYQEIEHKIGDKWRKFDPKQPPDEYLVLGGGQRMFERPDVWIPANESVVISVKAASIHPTEQFRYGQTLRFPRFRKLRLDRSWDSALSIQGFRDLRNRAEEEKHDKEFKLEESRRKARKKTTTRKGSTVAGAISEADMQKKIAAFASDDKDPTRNLFDGLTFCILSDCDDPKKWKRSKGDVEAFVKAHGGKITQKAPKPDADDENARSTIIVSDKDVIKVRTLAKSNSIYSVVKCRWIFECVEQAKYDALMYPNNDAPRLLLPYEPKRLKYVAERDGPMIADAVDEYGDSYARDVADVAELRETLNDVPFVKQEDGGDEATEEFLHTLEDHGQGFGDLKGWMFKGCTVWFDDGASSLNADAMDVDGETAKSSNFSVDSAKRIVRFASGAIASSWRDGAVSHVVVQQHTPLKRMRKLRQVLAQTKAKGRLPRLVTGAWVEESWREGTRMDEERFAPA